MAENTVSFIMSHFLSFESEILIRKSAVGCLQNHFEQKISWQKNYIYRSPTALKIWAKNIHGEKSYLGTLANAIVGITDLPLLGKGYGPILKLKVLTKIFGALV